MSRLNLGLKRGSVVPANTQVKIMTLRNTYTTTVGNHKSGKPKKWERKLLFQKRENLKTGIILESGLKFYLFSFSKSGKCGKNK